MCLSYIESLYTGEVYITPEVAREQRDELYPTRVINENNKIVNFCLNSDDAREQIEKRNQALILLGRCPKKYYIVSKFNQDEFFKRKTVSNRKSKSVVRKIQR